MIEFSALGTFLELLQEILKISHSREHERIDKLIHPTFTDMMAVHRDYLHMFAIVRRSLESKRNIRSAARMLEENRDDLSALRRSTLEIARTISEGNHFVKYRPYFVAICDYFDYSDYNYMLPNLNLVIDQEQKLSDETPSEQALTNLRIAELLSAHNKNLRSHQGIILELITDLDTNVSRLEDKWQEIAKQYAKILVNTF